MASQNTYKIGPQPKYIKRFPTLLKNSEKDKDWHIDMIVEIASNKKTITSMQQFRFGPGGAGWWGECLRCGNLKKKRLFESIKTFIYLFNVIKSLKDICWPSLNTTENNNHVRENTSIL